MEHGGGVDRAVNVVAYAEDLEGEDEEGNHRVKLGS
jgi:hypothetical protein